MTTSTATTACTRCGAPRTPDAPIYCTSCGAKQATGVADPTTYRTIDERYELVTKQPAYARALTWTPRLPAMREFGGAVVLTLFLAAFSVLWIVVAGLLEAPRSMQLGGAAIGAVAIAAGVLAIGRAVWRVRAPTHRELAVVLAEGDAIEWNDLSGRSRHPVTLRSRDGSARRAIVDSELLGSIVPGDIGVAYTQADRVSDFRWFQVMPMPLPDGEPPRVPSCAACAGPLSFESRDRCLYCDAPLADPALGEHGARFAELAAAPATQASLRRVERGGLESRRAPAVTTMIGVVLLGLFARLHHAFAHLVELQPIALLALVPPTVLVVGGAWWWWRRSAPRRASYHRAVAMVLRTRQARVGRVNDQLVYRSFVTLLSSSGGRRELCALPATAEALAAGSFGVAHVRGGWLVAFDAT